MTVPQERLRRFLGPPLRESFAKLLPPDEIERAVGISVSYTHLDVYKRQRSTLRVFTRNKMAMFLLGVIIVLLLFTFIQPYLCLLYTSV